MEIKGKKGGVLVTLDPGSWLRQKDALITKIQTQERFFKGGKIAVDVGDTELSEEEIEKFIKELSDEGVYLWAVLSNSEVTKNAAKKLDILSQIEDKDRQKKVSESKEISEENTWIERNIIEGEKVITKGNIFIVGNVEKGAIIITSGSIFVWGSLYGSVHAGCDGKVDVKIGSLRFQPEELKIADIRYEAIRRIDNRKPTEAFIVNNQISIETQKFSKLISL